MPGTCSYQDATVAIGTSLVIVSCQHNTYQNNLIEKLQYSMSLNLAQRASAATCLCLFYPANEKKVYALDSSGRSPLDLTLDTTKDGLKIPVDQIGRIRLSHVLAVTIPGAAAGRVDTVEWFGNRKLMPGRILGPAIELCEEEFPVSEDFSAIYTNIQIDR